MAAIEDEFDLNSVILYFGLDKKKMAEILFPKAKYPMVALSRVLKKSSYLDTAQLSALASYLCISTVELFQINSWKQDLSEKDTFTVRRGDYTAKLNFNGAFLSVFKSGELVHKEVNGVQGLTINAFYDYLNTLINKLNSYEQHV